MTNDTDDSNILHEYRCGSHLTVDFFDCGSGYSGTVGAWTFDTDPLRSKSVSQERGEPHLSGVVQTVVRSLNSIA